MPLRELCVHVDLTVPFCYLYNDHVIARIDFAIFIKLSCDGFMFPSFRNNDLSYSAHEFAFRMHLINCIDIMASDQFSTNNGMVSCLAL